MKSIHVNKSIDSTNYSKVRLHHLKYTLQLTLPSSSSLLTDLRPTTFQKLTRLKKILHLHISDSNAPLSLSRHYRRFLLSSSHSIKAITNNSIALDNNIRSLKDIRVLKSIQVNETQPPRPLRILKNIHDISFTYKAETLRFPTPEDIAKLEAFYKAIIKALPRLKKISCDNISNLHLQSLKTAIQARPSSLDQVHLSLKSSVMQYLNFSLEAIQDLITTFSVDIATRRAFSTYITAASSFKNLQSLDLDLFCDSLTNWSVDMLGSLANIPSLKAFKLTASVPLEQYIQQLKLPESLNALILQFRDAYTKVENTTIIRPVEKAFERLVELISSLKNLRSLRIEMHPAHDGIHIIFTEAFKQMMQRLPPMIEDLSIIEWYFINRSHTLSAEQLMIPSPQLVKCLSEMKSLRNLSLYMNISLFESPIKYVLGDLRGLALTLNVESCSINEVLVALNPDKLDCLSIWNRGPRLGWISEGDFIEFCENLQEFELIKELKIIGFYLDEVTEGCMNAMIEALIGLRYLESCMISIFVKKSYQDVEGMRRLKEMISVKKTLRSAKIKIESNEENRAVQEGFEVSLERNDRETVVNNNNGGM